MGLFRFSVKKPLCAQASLGPGVIHTRVEELKADTPAQTEEQRDQEIVAQVVSGDRELFSLLVRRYQGRVFALIQRQIGSADVAADLSQEVFIRAYRGLGKFRGGCSFLTWLTRIAFNVTHSYFASRRYRESRSIEPLEKIPDLAQVADTDPVFKERLIQLMQAYISTLKPKYREVIVLCIFERYTYREAAEILSIPEGTVCSRINVAVKQLREKMERHR